MRGRRYEECYNKAKEYTTLKDFRECAFGYYNRALNKDWLKDFSGFIIKKEKIKVIVVKKPQKK